MNNINAIELLIGSSQLPKQAATEPENKPVVTKADMESTKAAGSKAAKKRRKGKKSAEPELAQDRVVVEEEDDFSIKRLGTNDQLSNRQ